MNVSGGVSLEIVIENECCAVESEVQECAVTECYSNYLSCCQNGLKDKEEIIVFANIDCVIGTFG